MSTYLQYDFFKDEENIQALKEELEKVKSTNDKVRKGLFARHNELAKMYIEISQRMEIIEKNICQNK